MKKKTLMQTHEKYDISSKTLKFSEWAIFLNSKKGFEKNDNLENFQLLDDFLKIPERIIPNKNLKNNEDLSEKSWSPNDELMTETLAKVFVKQKKYRKAIEAYQILGLKYPEKNSLFANQIKEIKKLKNKKIVNEYIFYFCCIDCLCLLFTCIGNYGSKSQRWRLVLILWRWNATIGWCSKNFRFFGSQHLDISYFTFGTDIGIKHYIIFRQ